MVGPFATFQCVDCNRHRLSLSSSFILVLVISPCRRQLLVWGETNRESVGTCACHSVGFSSVLPNLFHKPSRNRSNQPAVAHQFAISPFPPSFLLLPSSVHSVHFLTPSHSWVFITLHLINNLIFFSSPLLNTQKVKMIFFVEVGGSNQDTGVRLVQNNDGTVSVEIVEACK